MASLPLFWRNFLAFWAGMAAIVAIGMALTASVAWYRFQALDGLNPASLTQDALQIARTQGRPGLERWVRAMDSRFSALQIYLVDEHNADILERRLPTRVHDWVSTLERPRHALAASAPRAPGASVSWWDPQPIPLPSGEDLLLVFLPFDSSRWEMLHLSPVMLALGLFALAVSAPLCWALTRHVTAPVQSVREAVRALAGGDLRARMPPALAARADELGHLARDFDSMAARLEALVRSRERMLRNIAHELRSPLARLQVSTELARRDDGRLSVQLDRIEREIERLDGLVAHTLTLARLGAKGLPLQPLELAGVVQAVVEDARFEAAARGVSIEWTAPPPAMVMGDRVRLASAIDNVLRNAIRHTDPASPIRVTLRSVGDRLELDIVDGGPGVPPDALPHLFEPFYRVRDDGRPDGEGSGLGLSIAMASIAAHGGGIAARNALPRGLWVGMWLPRAMAQTSAQTKRAAA
ncbi:sensor histidine kinase [Cupriavidus gilardii]|uniref:sensor histidine kinase n=1 Tax=Cupriavidus gilardii TaxID=82541 RepID=UPI0021BE661C|nr:ATP-binding protein [Cupriavidus gilardii]MCT9124328.1 ATP-binding protein [Cupriavidus gilardii]